MQIPNISSAAARARRAEINAQMKVGAAANPRLEAEKAALNEQIRGNRMTDKGVEAMPRVGPQTSVGLRPRPVGDGRTNPGNVSATPPWAGVHQQIQSGPLPISGDDAVKRALELIAQQNGAQAKPVNPLAGINPLDPTSAFRTMGGALRPPVPGFQIPRALPSAPPVVPAQQTVSPQARSQTLSQGIGMDGKPIRY